MNGDTECGDGVSHLAGTWRVSSDDGAIQGEVTIQNKQRAGGSSKVVFTGKPQDVLNQYELFYLSGWEVQLTTGQNTGVWTVECTINRDVINNPNVPPTPNVRWTLGQTVVQQHLLECTDRPTIALLSTAAKEAIESQLKNPLNMATVNYAAQNPSAPDATAIKSVYNLMRLGVESREKYYPCLKRTATVPAGYNIGWTAEYEADVLQNGTLLGTYNIDPAIVSLMPQSTTPVTDVNGVTTFGGWLEKGPNADETGDNKVTITQEWQFGDRWNAIEYDQY